MSQPTITTPGACPACKAGQWLAEDVWGTKFSCMGTSCDALFATRYVRKSETDPHVWKWELPCNVCNKYTVVTAAQARNPVRCESCRTDAYHGALVECSTCGVAMAPGSGEVVDGPVCTEATCDGCRAALTDDELAATIAVAGDDPDWHVGRERKRCDLRNLADDAELTFWALVAERLPECETGDLDIGISLDLAELMRKAVESWYESNRPEEETKS